MVCLARITFMNRRELLAAAAAAPLALALPEAAPARPGGGTAMAFVTADTESHVVALDLNTRRVQRRIRTLPGPRSIESAFMTWAVVAHTATGPALDPARAHARRPPGTRRLP